MKQIWFAGLLIPALILALGSTGCKHHQTGVTPMPKPGSPGETPNVGSGTGLKGTGSDPVTGIPANPAGSHQGWMPNTVIFQTDAVHFDYDSTVVKPEEKSKLAAVADYLKSNSADAVRVEGHCDERGTEEYNRALGDRRALALREELVHLGIDATRVDTISFGKDRPADTGKSEDAHKKNRRGEFILLTPPK
jgi:peptidoglycan-associated lipoprotein